MEKKFVLYIVLGLLTGAIFGSAFVPVLENKLLGISGGVLFGVFMGWFIAVAIQKYQR